jgi:hypothetical protein
MARTVDIEELLYWAFREQKVETTRVAPEDAMTIYWAVMALPAPFDQLVRHHARIGRPPNWRSVTDAKVVHLVAVRYWRERYTEWHKALTVLQHTVNGALRNYRAVGPTAPSQPWRDGLRAVSDIRKPASSALHSIP